MRYVRKPDPSPVPGASLRPAESDALGSLRPAIWEYLTCEQWEDGTPRQTATVTVFWEDSRVKLCLNDRFAGRSLWVSGESLIAALDALEGQLEAGTGDWRRNRTWPAEKKRGR